MSWEPHHFSACLLPLPVPVGGLRTSSLWSTLPLFCCAHTNRTDLEFSSFMKQDTWPQLYTPCDQPDRLSQAGSLGDYIYYAIPCLMSSQAWQVRGLGTFCFPWTLMIFCLFITSHCTFPSLHTLGTFFFPSILPMLCILTLTSQVRDLGTSCCALLLSSAQPGQ